MIRRILAALNKIKNRVDKIEEAKKCVDCKHSKYIVSCDDRYCRRNKAVGNVVDWSERIIERCECARIEGEDTCGPEGKYWVRQPSICHTAYKLMITTLYKFIIKLQCLNNKLFK